MSDTTSFDSSSTQDKKSDNKHENSVNEQIEVV
jgi:hypothetical protein